MKNNLGQTDRIIRLSAAGFLVLYFFIAEDVGLVSDFCLVSGIILFVTAFAGICPFYLMLGIDTTVKNRT
jgi:hypothetical protein